MIIILLIIVIILSDGHTNCNQCAQYSHQMIDKRSGGIGNQRTSGDHPNYCTVKIGPNNEKSPRGLRRLAVT